MLPKPTHEFALLCRVGFENDLVEELRACFSATGAAVEIESTQAAVVRVRGAPRLPRLADLVFARDLMVVTAELRDLSVKDRVTPIAAALGQNLGLVTVLAPDSETTKPLAPLLTALQARLRARGADPLATPLSVWMLAGTHALVGHPSEGGAAFAGGIPRLKFPREAPSRSTLKLDEAFQVLLSEQERATLLRVGATAVDLGAAPGGWTYQLVMRQIRVTAIDNGRIDTRLMDTGLVQHLREDGFRYRPAKAVDWLVCDMVEKPDRVAELVARWFAQGWCRAAVFNLKLPMKRRFEAWVKARAALMEVQNSGHAIRARQLYHDREEITVAIVPTAARLSRNPPAARGGTSSVPATQREARNPTKTGTAPAARKQSGAAAAPRKSPKTPPKGKSAGGADRRTRKR